MRSGTRLGVDVGRARIGVARCDPGGVIATPVETVPRDGTGAGADARRIVDLAEELAAIEVVVGLPLNLRGASTASTADAEAFARRLATLLAPAGRAVRLVDERLSTVSAQDQLRSAGRGSRQQRAVIDQAAAVVILQHALDSERSRGFPTGSTVDPGRESGPAGMDAAGVGPAGVGPAGMDAAGTETGAEA